MKKWLLTLLAICIVFTSVIPTFAVGADGTRVAVRRPRSLRPSDSGEEITTFLFYDSKETMQKAKEAYETSSGKVSQEGLVSRQTLEKNRYPANVLYDPPFKEYGLTEFRGWFYDDGQGEKAVPFGQPLNRVEAKTYFAYPKDVTSRHLNLVYGGVVLGTIALDENGHGKNSDAARIAGQTRSLEGKGVLGWARKPEKSVGDAEEHGTLIHLAGELGGDEPTEFTSNDSIYPIVADVYAVRFDLGELNESFGINLPVVGGREVNHTFAVPVPVPKKGATFVPGGRNGRERSQFVGGEPYETWSETEENKTGYALRGWYVLSKDETGKVTEENLLEKDGFFYKEKDGQPGELFEITRATTIYARLEGKQASYRVIFRRERRPAAEYRSIKHPEGPHYVYYGDPTVYEEKQYEYLASYDPQKDNQPLLKDLLQGAVGSQIQISADRTSDGEFTYLNPEKFPTFETFMPALEREAEYTEEQLLGSHYNWETTNEKGEKALKEKLQSLTIDATGRGAITLYLDRDDAEVHAYDPKRPEHYKIYRGFIYGQDTGNRFGAIVEDVFTSYLKSLEKDARLIVGVSMRRPEGIKNVTEGTDFQIIPMTLEASKKNQSEKNFWAPGTDLSGLQNINPELPKTQEAWVAAFLTSPQPASSLPQLFRYIIKDNLWKIDDTFSREVYKTATYACVPLEIGKEEKVAENALQRLNQKIGPLTKEVVEGVYPTANIKDLLDTHAIYLGQSPYAFMVNTNLLNSFSGVQLSSAEFKPLPGFEVVEYSLDEKGNGPYLLPLLTKNPYLSTALWDIAQHEVDEKIYQSPQEIHVERVDRQRPGLWNSKKNNYEPKRKVPVRDTYTLFSRWLDIHRPESVPNAKDSTEALSLDEFIAAFNDGSAFDKWSKDSIIKWTYTPPSEDKAQLSEADLKGYFVQAPFAVLYHRKDFRLHFEAQAPVEKPNLESRSFDIPFQAPIRGGKPTDRAHVPESLQNDIETYRTTTWVKAEYDRVKGDLLNGKTVTRNAYGEVFQGWYLDPAGEVPFEPEKTRMPEHDLPVFAVWKPETVNVRFHNVPEGSLGADDPESVTLTKKIPLGGSVSDPGTAPAIIPPGYSDTNFLGWYEKGATDPFIFVDSLHRNVDLYPKWAPREARIAYIFDYDMSPQKLTEEQFLGVVRGIHEGKSAEEINAAYEGVLKLSDLTYVQRRNIYVRSPLGFEDPSPVTGKGDRVIHPQGKEGTKSDDRIFLGWKMYYRDENNGAWRAIDEKVDRYYTNTLFNVDQNNISHNPYTDILFFVAQWGEKIGDTTLTFHGNNGADPEPLYVRDVRVGDEILLPTLEETLDHEGKETTLRDLGFTKIINGKIHAFGGWSTDRQGKGTLYTPGQRIQVDALREETENHLYAVWKTPMPLELTKVWVNTEPKAGYKVGLLVQDKSVTNEMDGFVPVPGSLKDLPGEGARVHWDVPKTSEKNEPLTYMAVEIAPGQEEIFKTGKTWEDFGVHIDRTGDTPTKEQRFGEGADAITSATLRQEQLIGNEQGILIRMTNTAAKVESDGPKVQGPDGAEPKAGDEKLLITPSKDADKLIITVPGKDGDVTVTLTKDPAGTWKSDKEEYPATAGKDGTVELITPPLLPEKIVTAIQEEPGKEPGKTEVIVKRDPTAPPTVTPLPKEGDREVLVTPPANADTLTITIPSAHGEPTKTITLTKDPGSDNWNGPKGPITPGDKGEIAIPMEPGDVKNGQPLVITAQDKAHHKDESTPLVVTPGKAQTAPVDPLTQEKGSENSLIVTGKAEPHAHVTITTPSGEVVHAKANEQGDFTAEIPREKVKDGEDHLTVITQVDGKNPSEPQDLPIDAKGPNPPKITPPVAGDEKVKITPAPDTVVVTVELPDGTMVTLTKDPAENKWVSDQPGAEAITPGEDGSLTITTPPLKENEVVTAKGYDPLGNPSAPEKEPVQKKSLTPAPEVRPNPVKGDQEVDVVPSPDATTITVTIPGTADTPPTVVTVTKDPQTNEWKTPEGQVVPTEGTTVKVPTPPLVDGKVITVSQQEPGKDPGTTHVAVGRGDPTPIPDVKQPTPGDDHLAVTPKGDTDTLVITLPPTKDGENPKEMTLTKNEDGTWSPKDQPETKIPVEPGTGTVNVPIAPEDQGRIQTGKPITVVGQDRGHEKDPSAPATVIPGVASSAPPQHVTQTKGDDHLIRVTGEGRPGATIIVKDPATGETFLTKVDPNGKFVVPIERTKLGDNHELQVIQQEEGKNPSPETDDTKVTIDTEGPQTPSFPESPVEGDRHIVVDPKDADTLVITHPDGTKVTYTKNPDAPQGWDTSNPAYPVEKQEGNGTLVVTTPPLKDDERITAKGYDSLGNPSEESNVTVGEKDLTKQPGIEGPVRGGDTTLHVKPNDPNAPAGSVVTVTIPGRDPFTLTKNENGSWADSRTPETPIIAEGDTIPVTVDPLEGEKLISVSQQDPGKAPSHPTNVVVEKTRTQTPEVLTPVAGADKLTITPKGSVDTLTVSLPPEKGKEGEQPKVVTLTKNEDGSWSPNGQPEVKYPADPETGTVELPVAPEDRGRIQPGVPITVTAQDQAGNKEVSDAATVIPGAQQSEKPKNVTQQPGDDHTIVVTGTGEPGAKVTVTTPSGKDVTVTVGEDKTFTAHIPRSEFGKDEPNTVTLTQTSKDKTPSDPVTVPIDRQGPDAPSFDEPTAGDKRVVLDPKDADFVVVTTPDHKTVTLTKDPDGNWTSNDPNYPATNAENGKIIITPKEPVKANDGWSAKGYDEMKNPSEPGSTQAKDKEQTAQPSIDPMKAGDESIVITPKDHDSPEGSVMTVTVPKGGDGATEVITLTKTGDGTWKSDKNPDTPIAPGADGKIRIPVAPLAPEQIISVVQQDAGKKPSAAANELVKKQKTEMPMAKVPVAHDETLTMTPPENADTLTITLPPDKNVPGQEPKVITLTKNGDGGWVRNDDPTAKITPGEQGEIVLPMKDDEKARIQRDTPIYVTAQDKAHNYDPSEALVLLPGAETTSPVKDTAQQKGNDQKITLTGSTEPHAVVTLKTPSGDSFTTTADDKGHYQIDIPRDRLKDGDHTVDITAQAPGKNPSSVVTQTIDKDGPEAPQIDSPTAGEHQVAITPKPDSATIVVQLPGNKSVTLTKSDDGWTSSDEENYPAKVDGEKILLTTGQLKVNQEVTAKAYDELGNPSGESTTVVKEKNPTPAPGLEGPKAGDEVLTITPDPEATEGTTLVVKVPRPDGDEKTITLTKDSEGNWIDSDNPEHPIVPENGTVKVPVAPLDPHTTIHVTQEEPGKIPATTSKEVTPVPTAEPEVKNPQEGDDHLLVKPPEEADQVTVTLPGGDEVRITKTPEGWKTSDGTPVKEDPEHPGFFAVPVEPEKVIKNIPLLVTAQDKAHKKDPSKPVPATPQERQTLPAPKFEPVRKGDPTIGVTPPEGADHLKITYPGKKITELQKQPDGTWVPLVNGVPDTAHPIPVDPQKPDVLRIDVPEGTTLTEADTIRVDAKDSTGAKKPSHGETEVANKEKLEAPDLLPPTTSTEDGQNKVLAFKPKEHADKTLVTVTGRDGTKTTLTVEKVGDDWTLNGEPLTTDPYGWVQVPYEKGFTGAEKITAHHEDSTGTYDPSDLRTTTVSGDTQTPKAPEVSIDTPEIHRDTPSLLLTPDTADKITVTIPAEDGEKTVTLTKTDQGWTSDVPGYVPTQDGEKVLVTIPETVHLEVGKNVTVVGENEIGKGTLQTKEVTPDGASSKPSTPVQQPKKDGFVPVVSKTTSPNPDGSYTLVDKDGHPITHDGTPTGTPITATPDSDGTLTFLVPDGVLKDGDPVGVRVEEPGKTPAESDKAIIDGKGPHVFIEGPLRPLDKTISLIPDDAQTITVKIPVEGKDTPVELTLTKTPEGGWNSTDPNYPATVQPDGKIAIAVPDDTILKGGTPVVAQGTDPLGNEGTEAKTPIDDTVEDGTNPPILPVEKDPETGQDQETPKGMVKLTFVADASYGHLLHRGQLTDRVSYFVDPGFQVSADYAPTIVAEEGYAVAGKPWTMDLPIILDRDTTIHARFVKEEATTPPVTPSPGEGETPEGYHRVVFIADPQQAELRGQTVYFVKDGEQLTYDHAPSIYPKYGYVVSPDPWSATLPLTVNRDMTIHARLSRVQDYAPLLPVAPTQPSIVHPIPLIVNPVKEIVKVVEKDANIQIHKAYVFGYPDGSFRPERSISRGEVAAIFSRLITGQDNLLNHNTAYRDVTASMWYSGAIHFLSEKKVLTGYPDGTFRPDAPITRAEFATIVAKVKALAGEKAQFPDVVGHWADASIGAVAKEGYVTGYPDGTFRPDKNITRAEAVTITNKMLDRQGDHGFITTSHDLHRYNDVVESHWAYDNIYEASVTHLYSRPDGMLHQEVWKKIVKKEELLGGLIGA